MSSFSFGLSFYDPVRVSVDRIGSQVQYVTFARSTGADLYYASSAHTHRYHRRTALRAAGGPDDFGVAMGTEKIDDRIDWDLVFEQDGVAAI